MADLDPATLAAGERCLLYCAVGRRWKDNVCEAEFVGRHRRWWMFKVGGRRGRGLCVLVLADGGLADERGRVMRVLEAGSFKRCA
jgi:hypothetical protein